MKKYGIIIIFCLLGTAVSGQQKIEYPLCGQDFRPLSMRKDLPEGAVYTDKNASPEARAADVVKRLNFEQKLTLTGGWNSMHFPAMPSLGLPPVYFSDASQGIHVKNICVKVGRSTSFPCELALAATWDPDLAYAYAKSIGEECQAWGISVLLGPGLNMYRNSEGGRNFEYMGEDPFLTSAMAVSYVKGLQSTGTIATIKHFIGNEQEFARHIVNVKIGERALREIYLPPFEASITNGGALAVMTGNNFVNGYPGAADKPLSEGVLRKEYGFKGIIMSDWANGMFWPKEQQRALGSGQSLFMSNNKIFADYVHRQIKAHPGRKAAMEKDLDTMVFHNLYTFFKDGIYDRPYRDPSLVNKIEGHQKTALQTAEEAITLLKNTDHILPIDPAKVNRIVVVGTPEALKVYTGTGSGKVEGYDQVDYPTGLENIYGSKIIHSRTISDDQIRSADVVLYFINKHAGEGSDKPFVLPRVDSMVNRYAALNKNLVVVYSGGNGLAMPWLQKTKAFVFAYLLGQQSGTALARVISGAVSPSGKLPFTIEKSFRQSPAYDYNKMRDSSYYWGGGKRDSRMMEKFGPIDLTYKEGIYMGYRWYDKKKFAPQFPFGFGLSYTTFDFSKLHLSSTSISKDKPVMVEMTITNTGSSAGAEVAQLYIHAIHSKIDRPVMALKGFKRILLKAGESKKIQIPLKLHDLAYWSETSHDWQVDHGRYEIALGASSKDIRQKAIIQY